MTINTSLFAEFDPKTSSSPNDERIGDVCIPNISLLERKKRLMFGIQVLVITLVILIILVVVGVNPLWRLPLFFMFSAGTTSAFQAFDKT